MPNPNQMTMLGSAQGPRVWLPASIGVFDGAISPAGASSEISFNSNGNIYETTNTDGTSLIGAWLLEGSAGDYQVQFTASGGIPGTFTSSPGAGYHVLSTTRTYVRSRGAVGESNVTGTITIQRVSDSFELATCPGELSAMVEI